MKSCKRLEELVRKLAELKGSDVFDDDVSSMLVEAPGLLDLKVQRYGVGSREWSVILYDSADDDESEPILSVTVEATANGWTAKSARSPFWSQKMDDSATEFVDAWVERFGAEYLKATVRLLVNEDYDTYTVGPFQLTLSQAANDAYQADVGRRGSETWGGVTETELWQLRALCDAAIARCRSGEETIFAAIG